MRCDICVLGVDVSPKRRLFLDALIDSLEAQLPRDQKIRTTLVAGEEARDLGARENIQLVAPESFGAVAELLPKLPTWYKEQLLALYFAAQSEAEFALVVQIGAFALAPLSESTLLPRDRARTCWETVDHHPDWWENAKFLTKRTPFSSWVGPSVLPAILSCELARWTLEIVWREAQGAEPAEALWRAIEAGRNWSAMTLYATAAGSRLGAFHHDSWASRTMRLMSPATLWSDEAAPNFRPSAQAIDENGLFTYVHVTELAEPDDVLDRLYASLGSNSARSIN